MSVHVINAVHLMLSQVYYMFWLYGVRQTHPINMHFFFRFLNYDFCMCVHVADFYIKIYLSKSVRWYSKGQSKVAELRQVYNKKVKSKH